MEFGIFPENLLYCSATPFIVQVWIIYYETIVTFGAQCMRFRSMDGMFGVCQHMHTFYICAILQLKDM